MEYPIKLERAVAPRLAVSAILYAAAFIAITTDGIAMNCGGGSAGGVQIAAWAVTVIAAIAIPVFCKVKHKRLNAFDMLTVAISFLLILFDLLMEFAYVFTLPVGPYTYTVERRWYFFYTTTKIFNYEWMYGDAEMWEGQELPEDSFSVTSSPTVYISLILLVFFVIVPSVVAYRKDAKGDWLGRERVFVWLKRANIAAVAALLLGHIMIWCIAACIAAD